MRGTFLIDYAVLEKSPNVVGLVPPAISRCGDDVGSWNAVYELDRRDAEGKWGSARQHPRQHIDAVTLPVTYVPMHPNASWWRW